MSTNKILISDKVADTCQTILKSNGIAVEYQPGMAPERLLDLISDYHGLIVRSATKVTAEVISRGKKLKVIGRAGAGVDNIDVSAATKNGIAVFNAAAANTISAAEHTFALMLALAREIPRAHISMLEGEWERSAFKGVELFNKTLGIIGLGKIGKTVAARAQAFNMKVIAYDPWLDAEMFDSIGVQACDLDELLRQSDFITIHVPLSAETRSLIGTTQFGICRNHLRIINTSRGGIVDEAALYQALKNGKIAAAALDVYEKEPPVDNPLIGLDNVITTPHLGASTFEGQQRVGEVIAECVVNYLRDGRVENIVNPEIMPASDQ